MRITQVILSKQLGGAESHVADLSNHLARNHDLHVILRRPPRRYASLQHGGNIKSLLDSRILVQEVGGMFRNRQMWRLIFDFRPDIIHTHLGDAGKSLRAIRTGAPLVGTLHGEYKESCYRDHDALICVSDWQTRKIPENFPGRVVTIPNFIPKRQPPRNSEVEALRTELGISANQTVIGWVGRFAPEKGVDILLQAFELAALKDTTLLLVGDGPERSRLENMAPTGVGFAGWRKDPWAFYGLFDIFALASRYESFGIAALEAMQAGVPVVSTRSAGPSEILKDGTGILVNIDSVAELAEAFQRLASSPDLRAQLATAGRKRAADYHIDTVVPRIEALYREMIRQNEPATPP